MAALVAQLMREQRSAEDKAIFDAYQNGGLYKGKPVTDGRILKHMEARRDGFSKDDPLYDQWNNQVIQQKFSIGEQKIGLAFQQGKVGAGAVAAFYRKSLSGIPKDSAFYRDVAGRAAQWAKSAAGAARGRARGRATTGLREKLNKQLETQQTYLGLEAALTAYAKREGLISGSQKLTDADATELQGMFDRGIYAGTDRITFNDFTSAAKDHYSALGAEIDTRLALGQQAVEARNKRSRFLGETMVRLNAVDERAQYELAREDWLSNVAAAGNDPYAVAAANDKYTAALQGIHKNASANVSGVNATDPEFIGGLQNEFDLMTTGKASGKTVYDLYDMVDVGGNSQQQAEFQAALTADMDLLDSGAAYYGQTEPGGEMAVVKWPSGGQQALGLDDSLQPSLANVNGQKRVVYLKGDPVKASVLLDQNNEVVDAATLTAGELRAGMSSGTLRVESGGNVGYVFVNPETGKTKYGVTDPVNGTMMFTDKNPWSSATVQVAGVGTTVFSTLATEDEKGNFLPNVAGILSQPISIDTADPLLSDGPVSPKDLMALIDSGTTGVSLSEEQLQKYQMRLVKQERDRLLNMQSRGPGGIGNIGADLLGDSDITRGGGGDLRSNILEGMNSVKQVTQDLFAGKMRDDATVFGAPPPLAMPKPTAPWQGLKPDGTPKDVVELTPEMPDRFAPPPEERNYSPHQPTKPKPPPVLSPYDPRNTPKSGVLE